MDEYGISHVPLVPYWWERGMNIDIGPVLKDICSRIVAAQKSESEWAAIESDDMFQTENYAGGFDATENAFTFSYYNDQGREFWFRLSLSEVAAVASGMRSSVEARPAER
jgi:hypothetical protein